MPYTTLLGWVNYFSQYILYYRRTKIQSYQIKKKCLKIITFIRIIRKLNTSCNTTPLMTKTDKNLACMQFSYIPVLVLNKPAPWIMKILNSFN